MKIVEHLGNVGQTAPKVGEVLRVSKILIIEMTTLLSDICTKWSYYDNPRNPDDTTVGHLDMNYYIVEFYGKPTENHYSMDDHENVGSCMGPNAECTLLGLIQDHDCSYLP
jgi:hypothetical protein